MFVVYDNNNSSIPETDKVQYLCVFPIKKRLTINGYQFCDKIFAQNKQILKNSVRHWLLVLSASLIESILFFN